VVTWILRGRPLAARDPTEAQARLGPDQDVGRRLPAQRHDVLCHQGKDQLPLARRA